MARPRKADVQAAGPTKERILEAAIGLFSERGFEGVSVREIARATGLTEGSLYNHFEGKAALLEAALDRLVERLIEPGLTEPEAASAAAASAEGSLEEVLLRGAGRFFGGADAAALKTWRILMLEQYRNDRARAFLQDRVLAQPRSYFEGFLEQMRTEGRVRPDADVKAAAAVLGSVFFEFSFTANLAAAWGTTDPEATQRLREAVRMVARALEPGRQTAPGADDGSAG